MATIKATISTAWIWENRPNGRRLRQWRVDFTPEAEHGGFVQSGFEDISQYDAQQEAKRVPLLLGYLREEITVAESE